jgi:hypothetical protein
VIGDVVAPQSEAQPARPEFTTLIVAQRSRIVVARIR